MVIITSFGFVVDTDSKDLKYCHRPARFFVIVRLDRTIQSKTPSFHFAGPDQFYLDCPNKSGNDDQKPAHHTKSNICGQACASGFDPYIKPVPGNKSLFAIEVNFSLH